MTDRAVNADKQIKLLQDEISDISKQIFTSDRQIVTKTTELDAEERGLGTTATKGRGPRYRQLSGELTRLQAGKANLELQRQGFEQQQLKLRAEANALENQIASVNSELSRLQGQIALIETDDSSATGKSDIKDIIRNTKGRIAELEKYKSNFERAPTQQSLTKLQTTCSQSLLLAKSLQVNSGKLGPEDCSTTALQPLLARTFALNGGTLAMGQHCIGKNANLSDESFANRLAFARDCLNWSELLPAESTSIISRINGLERERDDKAHRFVVTTNAFFDGNKLAFLAIAIAGAIDVLVLASGFLGATAIRSPLSGSGLNPTQSAAQREAIITSALLPDIAVNARSTLEAAIPFASNDAWADTRWTHQLESKPQQEDRYQTHLRKFVNAATAIGAATPDTERSGVYLLKSELIEFLAGLSRNATIIDDKYRNLPRALVQAFGSDATTKAQAVLAYIIPSVRDPEYSSGIDIASIEPGDEDAMRACLNASAFGLVSQQQAANASSNVLIKSVLYFAILDLASRQDQNDLSSALPDKTTEVLIQPLIEPQVKPKTQHRTPSNKPDEEITLAPVKPHLQTVNDTSTAGKIEPSTLNQPNNLPVEPSTSPTDAKHQSMDQPSRQSTPAQAATETIEHHNGQTAQAQVQTQAQPDQEPDQDKRRPRILITNDTFSFD